MFHRRCNELRVASNQLRLCSSRRGKIPKTPGQIASFGEGFDLL